jgi:colanic acid biosynthesis glycosyl transferase WcaI
MKILLLNQAFHPDVVATAQMLSDLACQLVRRGHHVTVVAARNGYDNPSVRFPSSEVWQGVNIIRIPSLNLGKKSKWRRAVSFTSFMMAGVIRLFFLSRHDTVVALTSPPLISFIGALWARWKKAKLIFWVMDLNPDEAIAAGWLRKGSLACRFLESCLQYSLKVSQRIVVLDRFMQDRLSAKKVGADKLVVIPPWPHEAQVKYDEFGRQTFRQDHGLTDAFVVMYSGNMSPLHPLDTLLSAAERLREEKSIRFVFVGGGSELGKVKMFAREKRLENVQCFPYQPLDRLSASLSAADLQTVVMGERFVGIIHPCKIYNILTLGCPFLYIGPVESHIIDLARQLPDDSAHICRPGDVDELVALIRQLASRRQQGVQECRGSLLNENLSQQKLMAQMLDVVENNGAA